MSLNKTFQLLSKNPYWPLLHNGIRSARERGDGAQSWQHQTTCNWDLGGWLWATLEVPVKLLSGEEESEGRKKRRAAEREESQLQRGTPLQPRRLGISITPWSCRRGKCCAEHNSAERSLQLVSTGADLGGFCWGQLVTRRQLGSNL